MARLSQKATLNEITFGDAVKGLGRLGWQGARGVASTGRHLIGKALPFTKEYSQNIQDVGGAFKGGWQRGESKYAQLDKFLALQGLIRKKNKPNGGIRGNIKKQAAVDVAELDYDLKGKPEEGAQVKTPAIVRYKDGEWRMVRAPRRGKPYAKDQEKPDKEKPDKDTKKENYSQKNMLQQLINF